MIWTLTQLRNALRDDLNAQLKPLYTTLGVILAKQEKANMDITALKGAFSTFSGDFSKLAADVTAFIAKKVPQDDPADIQAVSDITAALGAMDNTVKSLDAQLNPPA